ncbi:MAG TPA: hypothetical protein V6D29_00275 [Leptolyngbyaceae cyanobacterium]
MNRNTLAIGLLLLIATLVFSPFGILAFLLLLLFLSATVYLLSVLFSPTSNPNGSKTASGGEQGG